MTFRFAGMLFATAVSFIAAPVLKGQNTFVTSRYQPITGEERFNWFVSSAVGPASLATSLATAGLDTLKNTPEEYGPHWAGSGKRYGLKLKNSASSSVMEASLGAILGEDPRYFRTPSEHQHRRRTGHCPSCRRFGHSG